MSKPLESSLSSRSFSSFFWASRSSESFSREARALRSGFGTAGGALIAADGAPTLASDQSVVPLRRVSKSRAHRQAEMTARREPSGRVGPERAKGHTMRMPSPVNLTTSPPCSREMLTSWSKAWTIASRMDWRRCSVTAAPTVDCAGGSASDRWWRPKMSTKRNAPAMGSLPSRHLADDWLRCICSANTDGRNRSRSRVSASVSAGSGAAARPGLGAFDFRRVLLAAASAEDDA